MAIQSCQLLLLLLLAVVVGSSSAAAFFQEPKTGVLFPDKLAGCNIQKTGVRTKGPIKVYAVGQYSDNDFLLQMTFGIGAEKMASALKDALKPRCNDGAAIDEFEALMVKGLPKGASKGTKLAFATKGGKLNLQVDLKNVGTIASKPLATAFGGIYTDKKAVCTMTPVSDGVSTTAADTTSATTTKRSLTPYLVAGCSVGVGYGVTKFVLP